MSKEPTISETANKIVEIDEGVRAVQGVVPRALHDMPDLVHHKGAKEVAVLTVAVREQAFTFKPVMEALQILASGDVDWSKQFLVAHELASAFGGPSFDWKKAPHRSYASFEDFYRRELEATWGEWEQLQHTYAQIIRGEITEGEARSQIEKRAQRAQQVDVEDQENMRPAGRPKIVDNKETVIHDYRPTGTSAAAFIRRLRKDAPAIHARVLAGELSPRAGMIEAGFRKKPASKKRSKVELVIAKIEKLTRPERRTVWEYQRKEFGK